MRKTTPILTFGVAAILSLFGSLAYGQTSTLVFNNGAIFYINGGLTDSAIVWVDGHVVNDDSVLVNKGKLIIKGDFINNAISGGNSSTPGLTGNDGLTILDGDWENNGDHNPGTGKVIMMEDGLITGSEVTTFHDLDLDGTTKRTMTINAIINETGTLALDSGEVATELDTLFVTNPNTNAISRAQDCDPCGFISSIGNGNLVRRTNLAGEYMFPVGSSIDNGASTPKYRPVVITPEGSALDSFSVRMVNNTYIQDFFMNILEHHICFLNQEYYHRVNQLGGGNASADMSIWSSEADGDELFDMISRREEALEMWRVTEDAFTGFAPPYERTALVDWVNYTAQPEDAYVLGRAFPKPPEVFGNEEACAFFETTFTVNDNGSTYDWFISPNEGEIVDSSAHSITVVWNDITQGHVSVTETIPNGINNGCESAPMIFNVNIFPQPIAGFDITTEELAGGIFIYDLVGFNDLSIDAQNWDWNFGDGFFHSDQNPFHIYDQTGQYEVILTVQNGNNCVDADTLMVNVVEGVIVPNVFTPNGDTYNDTWDIRTSDVGDFHAAIYNRWGTLVWETTSPQVSWDGSTNAGVEASAGVYYYYIDKIALNSGTEVVENGDNIQFKETGFVHLIR
ncbi:MAG: gliding motility-associated-like protein [Bacteroidia bacterium]|jgi:gliding motility-associated-like protein